MSRCWDNINCDVSQLTPFIYSLGRYHVYTAYPINQSINVWSLVPGPDIILIKTCSIYARPHVITGRAVGKQYRPTPGRRAWEGRRPVPPAGPAGPAVTEPVGPWRPYLPVIDVAVVGPSRCVFQFHLSHGWKPISFHFFHSHDNEIYLCERCLPTSSLYSFFLFQH